MKVATILPVAYQYLEADNDYHMALAHLAHDDRYASFFRGQARQGRTVIMDNGVVETGEPMSTDDLFGASVALRAEEIILPDAIGNRDLTLQRGRDAIKWFDSETMFLRHLMAVPQGRDAMEWGDCLLEMLTWPVRTIGISKFVVVNQVFGSRIMLLYRWIDQIVAAGKQIHLLGSPQGPAEIEGVQKYFGGQVRGVDSGYPAFCAAGRQMVDPLGRRPYAGQDINFLDGSTIDKDLMEGNYRQWRKWCDGTE